MKWGPAPSCRSAAAVRASYAAAHARCWCSWPHLDAKPVQEAGWDHLAAGIDQAAHGMGSRCLLVTAHEPALGCWAPLGCSKARLSASHVTRHMVASWDLTLWPPCNGSLLMATWRQRHTPARGSKPGMVCRASAAYRERERKGRGAQGREGNFMGAACSFCLPHTSMRSTRCPASLHAAFHS